MNGQPAPGPRESILGSGAGGPLTAPSPWVTYEGYVQYGGGVAVGNVANMGNGALNTATLYINGVLVNLGLYFPFTGGTFTGIVTLAQDPVGAYDAVTKRYVDAINTNLTNLIGTSVASYVPLAGGTMTGLLSLSGDPTANLQAATKQYVDTRASGFTMPDAPNDGSMYVRQSQAWVALNLDAGTY